MKLFIVGNGFDIAHGMKTSYKDFREFLKTTEKGHHLLNLYPVDDEMWSDFESNICMVKTEEITEVNRIWGMDIVYRSLRSDINLQLESFVRGELEKTSNRIFDGISNQDFAIDFNYTGTLVNTYGLDLKNNVIFIHGSTIMNMFGSPIEKPLVFGHDGTDFKFDHSSFQKDEHYRDFITASEKPTKKVIAENQSFFNKLEVNRKNISEVVIFGCSFSKVDSVYFQKVVSIFEGTNTRFSVYYYSDKDKLAFDNAYLPFFPSERTKLIPENGWNIHF